MFNIMDYLFEIISSLIILSTALFLYFGKLVTENKYHNYKKDDLIINGIIFTFFYFIIPIIINSHLSSLGFIYNINFLIILILNGILFIILFLLYIFYKNQIASFIILLHISTFIIFYCFFVLLNFNFNILNFVTFIILSFLNLSFIALLHGMLLSKPFNLKIYFIDGKPLTGKIIKFGDMVEIKSSNKKYIINKDHIKYIEIEKDQIKNN
jgi:sRNA-binding regulator protein Hfq